MKQIALITIAMFLFFGSSSRSPGQSAPVLQQGDQVTVGRDLVSVNVSVTDRGDKYVGGLTRDRFEVFDNNVKQRIAFFSAEDSPSVIGIVYDMHPSPMERTRATLGALRQFVKTLRHEDRFFIVAFNEHGSLVLDFVPTLDQVETNLTSGAGKGPNSLYDAIFLAAGKIREAGQPKRALMVISDGADHQSQRSYEEVRDRLGGFDVQIYALNLPLLETNAVMPDRDRWVIEDWSGGTRTRLLLDRAEVSFGRAVLEEMSRVSGGTAYYPEARSDRELIGICTQIAFEMRRQYAIGFYPAEGQKEAQAHRLRIIVRPVDGTSGRLTLAYRQSYQLGRPSK